MPPRHFAFAKRIVEAYLKPGAELFMVTDGAPHPRRRGGQFDDLDDAVLALRAHWVPSKMAFMRAKFSACAFSPSHSISLTFFLNSNPNSLNTCLNSDSAH